MPTTYCFRCPECGAQFEVANQEKLWFCDDCMFHERAVVLLRDYRAEQVGFSGVAGIKAEREGRAAGADLILPTTKDFEKPSDPTGEKGMKQWLDNHGPRETNKNPRWPTRSERQGA